MMGTIQTWKTFRALDCAERGVACSAAAGLAVTWIGLRVFGFSRWQRMLGRRVLGVASNRAALSAIPAKRIAQLQEAAARNLFFPTSCLERSLALWFLLKRRGFPAELRFGARKQSGKFEAHAWVELEGAALNNSSAEQREFAPFEATMGSMETQAK